jgi:hypothetical protein
MHATCDKEARALEEHMDKDIQLNTGEAFAHPAMPCVKKAKLDLVILRYMAQRVSVTLRSLAQETTTARPVLYYLDERRRRTHRMAIYNPEELLLHNGLAFVGFVSGKLKPLRPSVAADLRIMDRKLVAELVNTPGLLSYSSLELHDGNWCNLVLLNDAEVKIRLKNAATHQYAAYELAPGCYEWIRLHNGYMPAGLAGNEMVMQKTRYYTYAGEERRPTIREISYQENDYCSGRNKE